MKAILVILLGITSCVLAADIDRRMRRDLFVDWLWNTDGAARRASSKDDRRSQAVEAERTANRTPKTRCAIKGAWYNHLGSEMIINTTSEVGVLVGEYRTAVERKHGSAGQGPSRLIGHTSTTGDFPTFGLTVMWRNGQSVTSWTGQCYMCDGEETLMTTWILKSHMDSCDDYWMANRIGQDTFKRYELTDGPRREEDTHNPRDFARRLDEDVDD